MQKKIKFYQIDAFTNKLFRGNPACVVPLNTWLEDSVLLNIAKENAVPETAFFTIQENGIHLRWFTPDIEMDLCGHATLASAHCIIQHMDYGKAELEFKTLSGTLKVNHSNGMYFLDFPSRPPKKSTLPNQIKNALSIPPLEVYKARDYLLLYEAESDVQNLRVNRQLFDQINLGTGGVIITSKGKTVDFVSRFFTPQASILEDPVTGSAHCSLIPFWAERIQKQKMNALQLSERGGELSCELVEDRVLIGGEACTYAEGFLST
jgi:PhzF family phenazine biosynthesis protein